MKRKRGFGWLDRENECQQKTRKDSRGGKNSERCVSKRRQIIILRFWTFGIGRDVMKQAVAEKREKREMAVLCSIVYRPDTQAASFDGPSIPFIPALVGVDVFISPVAELGPEAGPVVMVGFLSSSPSSS